MAEAPQDLHLTTFFSSPQLVLACSGALSIGMPGILLPLLLRLVLAVFFEPLSGLLEAAEAATPSMAAPAAAAALGGSFFTSSSCPQ